MHYVYILKLKNGTTYTGRTDNLRRRIEEHKLGKVRSTNKRAPRLIFYEAYIAEKDAIKRELFLKTGDGRQNIKKQLQNSL